MLTIGMARSCDGFSPEAWRAKQSQSALWGEGAADGFPPAGRCGICSQRGPSRAAQSAGFEVDVGKTVTYSEGHEEVRWRGREPETRIGSRSLTI
jgi:hypothetical protein